MEPLIHPNCVDVSAQTALQINRSSADRFCTGSYGETALTSPWAKQQENLTADEEIINTDNEQNVSVLSLALGGSLHCYFHFI